MSTIQDALKALKRGVKNDGESYRLRDAVIDAVVELEADNARLRALVKKNEWQCGEYTPHCVYCESGGPMHFEACPAFTPDGAVK